MQRIPVKDFVGQNAITLDDGKIIYNLIHDSLLDGNEVELDFNGVEVFASPFFNAGIGHLLIDLNPESLNKLLKFRHLSEFGSRVMRRVIDNAKSYYFSSKPEQRTNIENILNNQFSTY